MVWGTSLGRRHQTTPRHDPAPPIVATPTAQCGACERWTVLADRDAMPKGWVLIDGEALCPDCARPRAGALREAIRDDALVQAPKQPSRFRGCRIGHEIAFGIAAIQIRAGAEAPQGRDERVQFLLAPHELDELIIELGAIRDQLTQSEAARG